MGYFHVYFSQASIVMLVVVVVIMMVLVKYQRVLLKHLWEVSLVDCVTHSTPSVLLILIKYINSVIIIIIILCSRTCMNTQTRTRTHKHARERTRTHRHAQEHTDTPKSIQARSRNRTNVTLTR